MCVMYFGFRDKRHTGRISNPVFHGALNYPDPRNIDQPLHEGTVDEIMDIYIRVLCCIHRERKTHTHTHTKSNLHAALGNRPLPTPGLTL
jgi:hypothetical protein